MNAVVTKKEKKTIDRSGAKARRHRNMFSRFTTGMAPDVLNKLSESRETISAVVTPVGDGHEGFLISVSDGQDTYPIFYDKEKRNFAFYSIQDVMTALDAGGVEEAILDTSSCSAVLLDF